MGEKTKGGEYSASEAQERFEAALRGALKAPHKPLKEKPKAKKEIAKASASQAKKLGQGHPHRESRGRKR
jgi:hypothetical protein